MAHILLLDVPGGNDFTVLEDAVRGGHDVTFFTGDLAHYERQGDITQAALGLAQRVIEVRPFEFEALEQRALAIHKRNPFDALLCLIDIRLIDASRLAERLGLRFLSVNAARLLRDKFSVRQALARQGLRQPQYALAETIDDLYAAVAAIGYPVLIKPSDGYGSQNVSLLQNTADLAAFTESFSQKANRPTDYGFGVLANNRFSVEQYVVGDMIGCDVFSDGTERKLLGINDKVMFPPPSFAMRGSCFPAFRFDTDVIRAYAFDILESVNFNFGAAHIEMIVAKDGPYLVEINPRLVGAQIPYQMGYAFERSIYNDLINLHLGVPLTALARSPATWFSVIRWITAGRPGLLEGIHLPVHADPLVRRVALFKELGAAVRPPINNGDRLGYVIAVGETPDAATILADNYVRDTIVEIA